MPDLSTSAEAEEITASQGARENGVIAPTFVLDLVRRVTRILEDLPEWCGRPSLSSPLVRAALSLIVIASCAVRAYTGLIASKLHSHDAFWLLDGAWRMWNGERPHLEFSSMQGFLSYVPTLIGLRIAHGTIWGFGYGQALMGLLLTAWMYLLARNRLVPVALALMCLATCFTAVSPFCLGDSPFQLSPAVTYNRYGYCFLAVILVEAVAEARNAFTRREFLGGFSTGLIVAALFFLKITFFVSAMALLLFLIPCKPATKQRWTGIAFGFVLTSLTCLTYYSFRLPAILHDLLMTAQSRRIMFTSYDMDQMFQPAAILLVAALGGVILVANSGNTLVITKVAVAGFIATACTLFTALGNNEEFTGLAMGPFVAILLAHFIIRYGSGLPASLRTTRGTVLLLVFAISSTVFLGAVMSMGFALYKRVIAIRWLPHMEGARLNGFAPDGWDVAYTPYVNEGLNLIEEYRRPGETLMCLDFTNPFDYALGIRPAPGGANGMQFKNSYNVQHHPSAEALFGAANLLIRPKNSSELADQDIQWSVTQIYGPYIATHYHLIGNSKQWVLYRHN